MISSVMATRFSHFTPVTELGAFITTVKVVDRLMVASGAWTTTDQNALEPAFDLARALIRERDPSRPLFLWVHVMRPHSPYAAPPPFLGRFNPGPLMRTRYDSSPINEFFNSRLDDERVAPFAGRYDEGLAYFDARIGDFIEWLKEQGVFGKSLLVVSSDHGESFSHRYGTHAGPMLHEDVIHVPLIIKEPGQTSGRRVGALSEQIDLMPTILDLAGVAVEGPVEGRSLRPALQGQGMDGPVFSMNFEQNPRFTELKVGSIAMIEGRWKYVRYLGHLRGPLIPALADALYDFQSDPGETINLVSVEAAVAARMRAAIDEQVRRHDQPPE
jgi:arylsulfatase A-like enzyme